MSDKLRAAAQQALDILGELHGRCTDSNDGSVEAITMHCPEVINALHEALAERPQMPIGNATLEKLREWEQKGELLERVWGTLVEQEVEIARLLTTPPKPLVRCPGHSDGLHREDFDGACMGEGCNYRSAPTPPRTLPRGPLSTDEVDDMAFSYCPSGAIGELRELIRAVERAHHVGDPDAS